MADATHEKNISVSPKPKGRNFSEEFLARMGRAFLSPFRPLALILMLSTAGICQLCTSLDFIGGVLSFFCGLVSLKYAINSMHAAAEGTPLPRFSLNFFTGKFSETSQQILIFVVLTYLGCLAFFLSQNMAVILPICLILLLCYPTLTLVRLCSGSAWNNLRPSGIMDFLRDVGAQFAMLCLFQGLLGLLSFMVAVYLIGTLSEIFVVFVTVLLATFFVFVLHESIGLFQNTSCTSCKGLPDEYRSATFFLVRDLVESGNQQEALRLLDSMESAEGILEPALAQSYYTLLREHGSAVNLLKFTGHYLRRLLGADMSAEALSLFAEIRQTHAEYLPPADVVLRLGEVLERRGQIREALALYNGLVSRLPDDDLAPEAYFRAALLLNERMAHPEKARALLEGVQRSFPEHPIQERVRAYLSMSF